MGGCALNSIAHEPSCQSGACIVASHLSSSLLFCYGAQLSKEVQLLHTLFLNEQIAMEQPVKHHTARTLALYPACFLKMQKTQTDTP